MAYGTRATVSSNSELKEFVKRYNLQLKILQLKAKIDSLNKENVDSLSASEEGVTVSLGGVNEGALGYEPTPDLVSIEAEDNGTVIAMCTPLMRRVHKLFKKAGELVFVDSGGKMERQNWRVYNLLTHYVAGGLQLGIVITSSETCANISSGLKVLQSLIGDDAVFSRGATGPQLFMTDASTS